MYFIDICKIFVCTFKYAYAFHLQHVTKRCKMSKVEFSVGLYKEITTNVNETLANLHRNGYDMMVTPVAVVNYSTVDNQIHLKRAEAEQTAILIQSARHRIITLISGNIDCDSTCESVRRSSETELLQQLAFADHLGTPSMIPLQYKNTHNLARVVSSRKIISKYPFTLLWFVSVTY